MLAVTATAAEQKLNVLFIASDDMRPQLGCYGDPLVKSPNLDRLAARGMVFKRAYCQQALCSPSRISLLSGRHPWTTRIYQIGPFLRETMPDIVTLPQHFKNNGYFTRSLGKVYHVGIDDPPSWSVPPWHSKAPRQGPEGREAMKKCVSEAKKTGKKLPVKGKGAANYAGPAFEAPDVGDDDLLDGDTTREALVAMRELAKKPNQPFFLAVGFANPHVPWVAPKKYWDLYKRDVFPLPTLKVPPIGAPEFAPTTWGELRQYTDIPEVGPLDDAKIRLLIHGYHAATSYMDAQVGRVLDALDQLGFAKNTIIVLWGDHGWHLGDHGMWCKHTNYEQAARIPFIVVAPGVAKPGAKTGALAETVDIYPSLCELAGLPAPQGLDGASFVKALKSPSATTKEAVFHVYPRGKLLGRAVRTARYRLVEWKEIGAPSDTAVFELYDYEADPAETKNLAADKPAIVAELRAILAKQPEAKPQVRADGQPAKKSKTSKSKQDRGAMFDKRDKNKDGKLTLEEFLAGQPDPDEAPKRFPSFDKNKDGFLSREEFIKGGKP